MIEQVRETGFCNVTLCGRLVEKPLIADPPVAASVHCPDGTYLVHATGDAARTLAGAEKDTLLLIRGRAKEHNWKLEMGNDTRHRLVIVAESARVLDARREECLVP